MSKRRPSAAAIRRAAADRLTVIRADRTATHRRSFFTVTCHACGFTAWVDGDADFTPVLCLTPACRERDATARQ